MRSGTPNYYQALDVHPKASGPEIKAAYRKALLRHHPDKSPNGMISVSLLKSAYETLSSSKRGDYDALLALQSSASSKESSVQVISLDEFEQADDLYSLSCRCGSIFRVTVSELEQNIHLLQCLGCSQTIWVGYDETDDS